MLQNLKMDAKNQRSDRKFENPVEDPFLVQTYPCRPKK